MVRVNTNSERGALLPDGDYEVKVEKAIEKEKEETGNVSVQIDVKVMEGNYEGQMIRDWLPFSENALWRTLPIIRGMGIDVPEARDDWNFDPASLSGLNFVATFTQHTYGGNTRNIISATNASDKKFGGKAISDDIPF